MTADPDARLPGSFRDPAGFMFQRGGTLFRQVNRSYEATFATLMDSGLYARLVEDGLLIPHETVDLDLAPAPEAAAVVRPAQLKFVSYPFEWSFSQLKAAALATLHVQRRALDYGLSLKDASARNIQLHEGRPRLIDTLSFERYEPGFPWVGYRQFCQHLLAPLAVMAYTDVRLGALLQSHLDGVPLDLASRLLPWRSRLRPGLLMHLHLHSRAQARAATSTRKRADLAGRMSRRRLDALLESLESAVAPDCLELSPHALGRLRRPDELYEQCSGRQEAIGGRAPIHGLARIRVGHRRQHGRLQPDRRGGQHSRGLDR